MKPIRLLALATVIAANLLCALQAETKLPSILGSHMVLQRNTPITLWGWDNSCLLYTSPSPRDGLLSRMPSSA